MACEASPTLRGLSLTTSTGGLELSSFRCHLLPPRLFSISIFLKLSGLHLDGFSCPTSIAKGPRRKRRDYRASGELRVSDLDNILCCRSLQIDELVGMIPTSCPKPPVRQYYGYTSALQQQQAPPDAVVPGLDLEGIVKSCSLEVNEMEHSG